MHNFYHEELNEFKELSKTGKLTPDILSAMGRMFDYMEGRIDLLFKEATGYPYTDRYTFTEWGVECVYERYCSGYLEDSCNYTIPYSMLLDEEAVSKLQLEKKLEQERRELEHQRKLADEKKKKERQERKQLDDLLKKYGQP